MKIKTGYKVPTGTCSLCSYWEHEVILNDTFCVAHNALPHERTGPQFGPLKSQMSLLIFSDYNFPFVLFIFRELKKKRKEYQLSHFMTHSIHDT